MKIKKYGRFCEPAVCDHCTYLGEGDFICDKNATPNEYHVVMENWQPTDKYLWCQNRKNHTVSGDVPDNDVGKKQSDSTDNGK